MYRCVLEQSKKSNRINLLPYIPPRQSWLLWKVVIPVVLIFFFSSYSFPQQPPGSVTFDLKVSATRNGSKVLQNNGSGWYKKGKTRVDLITPEGKISSLYDGKRAFSILHAQKTALELPIEQLDLIDVVQPGHQRYSGKKVGTERLDGRTADIYEYEKSVQVLGSPDETKVYVKEWIWKEKEFPLKFVFKTEDIQTTVELKNIKFGQNIADTVFQLPDGMQVASASGEEILKRLTEPKKETPKVEKGVQKTKKEALRKSEEKESSEDAEIVEKGEPEITPKKKMVVTPENLLSPGIPVYPGSKEVLKQEMGDGVLTIAIYSSSDNQADIGLFYREYMKKNGWKQTVSNWADETVYEFTKQERSLTLSISPKKRGSTISMEIR